MNIPAEICGDYFCQKFVINLDTQLVWSKMSENNGGGYVY